MSDHLTTTQLRRTAQITQEWLNELAEHPAFANEDEAYSYLRAVLHALRDRLTVEEAAHLASQLPMLVRGFYYEGWRPALAPNEFETVDAFYARVRESLGGTARTDQPDVRDGTRAALELLADRVDAGALRHLTAQLPAEIQELVPEPEAA